jgi:ABC-2 type transport system ATP-binding protein
MKQRLGLAMALLNEPEFLILDEPTNGLDPAGIRDMRELLRRLVVESGITVFRSSHLLSEVEQIAIYLGIIHQGRLLFQGTLNELQRTRRGRPLIRTNDPQALGAEIRFPGMLRPARHRVWSCWTSKEEESGSIIRRGHIGCVPFHSPVMRGKARSSGFGF